MPMPMPRHVLNRHSLGFVRAIAITLTAATTVGCSAQSDASSLFPFISAADSPTQVESEMPPNSEISRAEIEFHPLPNEIQTQVLQFAAEDLDIPLDQLNIERHSRETWSDSCLGLGGPAELCMMMLVEGWQVEVVHESDRWFYHTDLTADSIRRSTYDSNLPPSVGDRLLSVVAADHDVPLEHLRVIESEPQTWNGCLGITPVDGGCTEQAIFGWRAIVRAAEPTTEPSSPASAQYWIYHTDNSGRMIRLNAIATPPEGTRPTFIPRVDPFQLGDETMFEMVMTEGDRQIYLLEADGRIIQPSSEETASPEITEISGRKMERFSELLRKAPFQDFDGIAYQRDRQADPQFLEPFQNPDEAELVAEPNIILRNRQAEIQYTPEVQGDLPPKLRRIVRRWNRLAEVQGDR